MLIFDYFYLSANFYLSVLMMAIDGVYACMVFMLSISPTTIKKFFKVCEVKNMVHFNPNYYMKVI